LALKKQALRKGIIPETGATFQAREKAGGSARETMAGAAGVKRVMDF